MVCAFPRDDWVKSPWTIVTATVELVFAALELVHQTKSTVATIVHMSDKKRNDTRRFPRLDGCWFNW